MEYGQTAFKDTGMLGQANMARTPYQDQMAKESPISREIDCLTKAIAELEMTVGGLIARVQPITIQRPPQVAQDKVPGVPTPNASVVGDAIFAASARVRQIADRLADMRDNLAI